MECTLVTRQEGQRSHVPRKKKWEQIFYPILTLCSPWKKHISTPSGLLVPVKDHKCQSSSQVPQDCSSRYWFNLGNGLFRRELGSWTTCRVLKFCEWVLRNRVRGKLEYFPRKKLSINSKLCRHHHICRGFQQMELELDLGHVLFICRQSVS